MEELLRGLAGREKAEIVSIVCQLISCFGLSQSDLHGSALPVPGVSRQILTDENQGVANAQTESENSLKESDNESNFSFSSNSKKRRFTEDFPPLPDVSSRKVNEWIRKEKPRKLKKISKKAVIDNVKSEARNYYSESEASSRPVTRSRAREVATSQTTNNEVNEMDISPNQLNNESSTEGSEHTVRTIQDLEPGSPAPTRQNEQPTATTTPKKVKIPPIVVRQKDKWVKFIKTAAEQKINFSKAVNLHDGIKVQPVTPDDYRRLSRLLVTENIPHHTYSLPEDRQIRAVFRGVPEHFTIDDIREELESKGFDLTSVTRMKRAGKPMPMVLALVNRDQKNIFEVTDLLSVKVQVEPQHPKTSVGQCHRCQRFGHCQRNCMAVPICVKCAGRHLTNACKKARTDPPKCNNCKGVHTANYRGCPEFPKAQKSRGKPVKKPSPPGRPAGSGRVKEGVSFARAASKGANGSAKTAPSQSMPSPQTQGASDICAALEQMKQLFTKFPVLEKMFTVNTNVLTGTANV
nr:uncharacterized protein LOC111510150 [Leptinotarsa decemlineata]